MSTFQATSVAGVGPGLELPIHSQAPGVSYGLPPPVSSTHQSKAVVGWDDSGSCTCLYCDPRGQSWQG